MLVKGQPCIIGGRSKAMKTSIAVDLAISLGSGEKFLGKYDVPKTIRVAFWTGESVRRPSGRPPCGSPRARG